MKESASPSQCCEESHRWVRFGVERKPTLGCGDFKFDATRFAFEFRLRPPQAQLSLSAPQQDVHVQTSQGSGTTRAPFVSPTNSNRISMDANATVPRRLWLRLRPSLADKSRRVRRPERHPVLTEAVFRWFNDVRSCARYDLSGPA